MTKAENKQRIKNEALNAIAKMYHPKYKFPYDPYEDRSCAEQREYQINYIIENMYNEISKLNKI